MAPGPSGGSPPNGRQVSARGHAIGGPVAVGLLAGFLAGMFGVGGGIIIVPCLVLFLGLDQRLAHGTSLAATLPLSTAALIGFAAAGEVDWWAAVPIIVGATVGAVIGTRWLRRLPVRVLRFTFAAVLAASAVRLLVQIPHAAGRGPLDAASIVGLILLGLVSGIMAGLLGVGGGIVIVPALVILWGSTTVLAKGTSLAVIIVTAIVGSARNLPHGNVDLRVAALVGVSGVVTAFVGTAVSLHIGARLSDALFAVLLFAVAVRMASMRDQESARPSPEPPAGP